MQRDIYYCRTSIICRKSRILNSFPRRIIVYFLVIKSRLTVSCFVFFRPRFCPKNRHPVPVGSEIQDHRIDPRGHRHNRAKDVEGVDPGPAIPGPVRRHGHLQVYQAQGGRSGDPTLPVAGLTCAPPRRIRSRQSIQCATARTTITDLKTIFVSDHVLYYLFSFVSQYAYLFIFIVSKKKTMIIKN